VDVRIFNTNTSRLIVDTIEVGADGDFQEDGDYTIPGVKGTGSEVKVAFVDPAGSMTGKLFPTGRRTDSLVVKERDGSSFSVEATLIDAANPFVVVDASTLPLSLKNCLKEKPEYLERMELIRRVGAVAMGLASSTEAAAKVRGTPKLALVSPPASSSETEEDGVETEQSDIFVSAFSMGKPHPSLQLTGAACLASAVAIEGTVAHHIASQAKSEAVWVEKTTPDRTPSPGSEDEATRSSEPTHLSPSRQTIRLSHSSGSIDVGVAIASSATSAVVDRCVVSRTARRLFEGKVYYYQ
jgi:2-methylaconitate cis-trans-isomerase PrpF